METWQRRTALYLGLLASVMLAYAAAYHYAMVTFEGRESDFLHSLQVVVETFTTTGFGSDAPWESPQANLLVIAMDLTGVLLIFMTLPLFVFPLFEEVVSTTLPTAVEGSEDHAIICTHTPRGDALVSELDSFDVDHVFVESDRGRARALYEEGNDVVHADPESVEGLRAAGIDDATALVADDDDETNASVVLAAKQANPDCSVVSVVERVKTADYHRYAGADEVVSPRHLLGERLAAKATPAVATDLGDAVEVGEDFEVAEMLVHRGSPLIGRRIADSEIGERTGASVIGAWFSGEFVTPPDPEDVIDEHTILLVAGRERQLEQLKELTLSETRRHARGHVVVAGCGQVGRRVAAAVADADTPVVALDREGGEAVDVVGDATDTDALTEADVASARSVVLTLDEDTTAIFATLALRQVAPRVEIIARADQTESVPKLYRAGADYVLSLSTVTGRMLASTLLDEEVLTPDTQVEIVRTEPGDLAGGTLAGLDVRARTGCTVIAVERDDELITDLPSEFRIESGDALVVAGADEDIARFNELAK